MTMPPARGVSSSTIRSTVTSERAAASTASFCTPGIPQSWTLPSRSASWAWTIATSGRSAGTAASSSPVNGQTIGRTWVCSTRSVQRAHARVPGVGEDELAGGADADQLVVEDVGRHPDQLQITPLLADQLVARGEGNQVREPLQGDGISVTDEIPHAVRKCA